MQKINKKSLKINIIPLIDIIFLMLVFFMLATNFSEKREVKFSIENTINTQSSSTKTINIYLKNNQYFLEEKEVKKELLELKVLDLWETNKYKNIVILNDETSEIKILIYLLDLLKKNQINQVTFANDTKDQ